MQKFALIYFIKDLSIYPFQLPNHKSPLISRNLAGFIVMQVLQSQLALDISEN